MDLSLNSTRNETANDVASTAYGEIAVSNGSPSTPASAERMSPVLSSAEPHLRPQPKRKPLKPLRPRPSLLALIALLVLVTFSLSSALASTVRITEFMAINDETIIDDDDDRSDWIELHNPTLQPVNLDGWYLLDSTDKWRFPNITLYPNSYLVVFASEKDRRQLGAPLHTNFRLSGAGEYLALLDPQNNVVTEFPSGYPQQHADVSYGLGHVAAVEVTLLPLGNPATAFIPTDDSLGSSWRELDFDDTGWLSGTTGVGYDYQGLIGLDVRDMRYVNETVYIRIPFEMDEIPEFDLLILRLQFEDGMIAYLNGQRIAGESDPEDPTWNSAALANRDDSIAVDYLDIDVSSSRDLLRVGKNVLAFHGLNYRLSSSDLLVRPQLVAVIQPEGPEAYGFTESPTPGAPNRPAFPGIACAVQFSLPSQTFTDSITVELTLPEEASPAAEIRYTLDGSVPMESSPVSINPLTISSTTQVRARVFEPSLAVGPVVSETYVRLNSDLLTFSSNLPLVMLENFGSGWMSQSVYQSVSMMIFEEGTGRSSLTAAPDLSTRAGIKIRGSSTAGRPKPSLSVEAWNESDDDKNISPLGMDAESDWVLWGPYNFDLALMRNPLIYELSNQVGRYATRGRFVEVFLNTGGGNLSYADYFGVYVLMEKISRDEDRVDVERLFPEHDREPGVTGGYMFKVDRRDPGDSGFSAAGQGALCYVYPKEVDIERPERDPQQQYVLDFFNEFGSALNGAQYKDPQLGYAKYIDVDSWVDHHLLNVIAVNVDAFRLSGYMFKKRGKRLEMGPIWDFDRSMGSTDGRDANPRVWRGGGDGTDFFHYPWWDRLFQDIDFFQKLIDRWQELKRRQFSITNIHSVINSMADEVREAQVRDLARWGQTPRFGGFQGEVDHLKQWLADRVNFMDSQFVSPPFFDSEGGHITPGFTLTMSAPSGEIYYTLDGSDPRLPQAQISSTAQVYQGPISLTDSVEVKARVYDPDHTSLTGTSNNPPLTSHWSGYTTAWFSIHPAATAGDVVITEVNFHPLDPTADELMVDRSFVKEDFEFIEVKNVGKSTVDLHDVQFTDGITFSFTGNSVTTLRPGELAVIVKNQLAFSVRYPGVTNVAGHYTGNLDNGGEALRLEDAAGDALLEFVYEDEWCPLTDGFGFSLVVLNEEAPLEAWGTSAGWRSSTNVGGSPGEDDPLPPDIVPVFINEVLTNTEPPAKDAIELHNPSTSPADIGGWYLTDDRGEPQKFRIPRDTTIAHGEYVVFDEDDFNPANGTLETPFALSSLGEEVYLFSADASGSLTGYFHGFRFGAAETDVSFGRHVISTGEDRLVAQISPTLYDENLGPRVGPVVINEIMFNPSLTQGGDNTRDEYIELHNLSEQTVSLFDPDNPENTWRIEGAVEYAFPPGVALSPGSYLLVVGIDVQADQKGLTAFQFRYGLDTEVTILGPYTGKLDNIRDRISLLKPEPPLLPPSPDAGLVPYVLVDEINYSSAIPWPTDANGGGQSLQRVVSQEYGDDPINWEAASPTAGQINPGGAPQDTDGDGLPDDWESATGLNPDSDVGDDGASGDPDGDGSTNLQEYLSGTHPRDPGSFLKVDAIIMDTTAVLVRFNAVVGKTYTVFYCDCLGDNEWQKLTDVQAQAHTGLIEIPDPGAGGARTRYYRLVTPQSP